MSELQVPMASHEAASKMRRDLVDYEDLQAIATPIVVAELRKIRDLVRNDPSLSGHDVAIYALERANELEGWS